MTTPASHSHPRTCDVAVVGGSAAGLAAALQLGRQRRSVIVIDAGEPRNAPAAHMHGYLGHEGVPPADLLTIAREEVRSYGVEVLAGTVVDVTHADDDRFALELADGHTISARRVVAATGLVDVLPDIEGITEHWGGDVVHCPFCHGFEVRDQRIVQVVTHPMGLHPAGLFRQLTDRLTSCCTRASTPTTPAWTSCATPACASSTTASDGWSRMPRATSRRSSWSAGTTSTPMRSPSVPGSGCGPTRSHRWGSSRWRTRAASVRSSRPGRPARRRCPGCTPPAMSPIPASRCCMPGADGSRVGAMVSFSLADQDMTTAATASVTEEHWDRRYAGERTWSGEPNGALVDQVGELPAGRALDVGAGEGGDAIWLAERGWRVTASDVSRRALDHVVELADERGVEVLGLHADANDLDPFAPGGYDLVTAHYVPLPRSPDHRAVHNLIDAVASGGTLLVVTHDLESHREPSHGPDARPLFDPAAFVGPHDVAAVLADRPAWDVAVHERRPRRGAAPSPHVADIVLRARRRAD